MITFILVQRNDSVGWKDNIILIAKDWLTSRVEIETELARGHVVNTIFLDAGNYLVALRALTYGTQLKQKLSVYASATMFMDMMGPGNSV